MHEDDDGGLDQGNIKYERFRSSFTVYLMELRGQDKEIGMQSSLVYNPPIRDSSSKLSSPSNFPGGERRRDGTSNGTAIDSRDQTQTLDPDSDPDPDPVPVTIAVAGATGAPISGGSKSRTPTTRTSRSFVSIRYRECLKNHAASIGGHVVDGCGEFMPNGEEGTPEALKCAACDCHRNFHRKEVNGEPKSSANFYYYYNPNNKNNISTSTVPLQHPSQLPPPLLQQHQNFPLGLATSPLAGPVRPMMMAFGGGGATESSSEELNVFNANAGGSQLAQPPVTLSKKRSRTKFSQEQKGKMLEFAEKVRWKIQKQDEAEVQQFCAEVGVERQVLKVWMHNNKNSMKNKPL